MKFASTLLLVAVLFISNVNAVIRQMSYAGCACVCNGDELAPAGSVVIVADAGKGLLFQYTSQGDFAGFIGSAIDCKQAFPFKPSRIVADGSNIYALNLADRSVVTMTRTGDVTNTSFLSDSELGTATPTSFACKEGIYYLSYQDGIYACEYDLTIAFKVKITGVVSITCSDEKLYALTQKDGIKIFDLELKELKQPKQCSQIAPMLKNAQDIYVDGQENLWIADTGNKRIVVLWNDGTFSTWGENALSYEVRNIAGDPIFGIRQKTFSPRRVAASNGFFFISTPDHQSFSVPIQNLTKRQSFEQRHCYRFVMSGAKYRKNIEAIWELQQNLFPQSSVSVTLDDEKEYVSIDDTIVDVTVDEVLYGSQMLECQMKQLQRKSDEKVTFSTDKGYLVCEKPEPGKEIIIVKVYSLAGGTNPLQSEEVGRFIFVPDDLKVSFKLPQKAKDDIFLVMLSTNSGKFVDFYWARP
jgi:hypothetical protein